MVLEDSPLRGQRRARRATPVRHQKKEHLFVSPVPREDSQIRREVVKVILIYVVYYMILLFIQPVSLSLTDCYESQQKLMSVCVFARTGRKLHFARKKLRYAKEIPYRTYK